MSAAGHERPPSARAATDAAQPPGGDASKQKHRRNRSLGSLGGILSLKSRGKDDKGKVSQTVRLRECFAGMSDLGWSCQAYRMLPVVQAL